MKIFIGFIVLTDLAFITICLGATRSGMEAMGVLFMLAPLAGLHLLAAGIRCISQLWKKKWGFPVYFVIVTALMFYSFFLYGTLKPKGSPVFRVLLEKAEIQKKNLKNHAEKQTLKARRMLERRQDGNHAELCQVLDYPTNLSHLEGILKKKPDLSVPCAIIQGRKALPIFVILAERYPLWRKAGKADGKQITADIRSSLALLLKYDADPNSRDELGNTPLHWVLRYGDAQMVSLLIDNGACVFLENNDGQRLINRSMSGEIREILDKAALDPEMIKNCSRILVQKSTADKYDTAQGGKHEPGRVPAAYWTKKLLAAGSSSHSVDRVAQAIAKGAAVNGVDGRGRTPLQLAARCSKETPAIMELLLTSGADVNSRDNMGVTPLMDAGDNYCPDGIAFLLSKGADPTLVDLYGATVMHRIARWPADRMPAAIDSLVKAGADINARDGTGRTPLMMTAYSAHIEKGPVSIFLAKGADPDVADHNGNTLLHLLVTEVSRRNPAGAIANLIEGGAAVDRRNRAGRTPMMLAVKANRPAIVKQLLAAGASPDVRTKRGMPLLHEVISCQPEKTSVLEALLEAECDPDLRNSRGETALHRALAAYSFSGCILPAERLLLAGADPDIQDRLGFTALHELTRETTGNPARALRLMQKYGADIDIRDNEGLSPLLRAARYSTGSEVMQAFLEAGANPAMKDNDGNTLLHLVAMNPKNGAVKRLQSALNVITDPDIRNKSGKTALDLALRCNNSKIIKMLEQAGAQTTSSETKVRHIPSTDPGVLSVVPLRN